jgi:hypothetical protein
MRVQVNGISDQVYYLLTDHLGIILTGGSSLIQMYQKGRMYR